jgi:hypothetical protein
MEYAILNTDDADALDSGYSSRKKESLANQGVLCFDGEKMTKILQLIQLEFLIFFSMNPKCGDQLDLKLESGTSGLECLDPVPLAVLHWTMRSKP